MRGVNLFETSVAVGLVRKFDAAYKDSWISQNLEKSLSQIKVCFRYSFLGRITEIGEEGHPEILDNSKVVRWVLNIYNIWKDRIISWANSSAMINSVVEVKKELYFLPVKTGGMIVFTAVLTNMGLSLFMGKEIGLFGWSLRGVLLVVGFWGMFCNVGWEELKRTSWFIKWIENGSTSTQEHQSTGSVG